MKWQIDVSSRLLLGSVQKRCCTVYLCIIEKNDVGQTLGLPLNFTFRSESINQVP